MDDKDDKDWDDNFPDGVFAFAVPSDPGSRKVELRRLVDRCEANGIPLSEAHRLPPDVMEQFLVYPNEDGEQEKKRD